MVTEDGGKSMESPLLPNSLGYEVYESRINREEILTEVKKQLKLAGSSVMFVGHLGELPLAGASMATSFASVTGFSLMRAMIVLLLVCIPLACIWANTGTILEFFGQDEEISAEAGKYARFMIPSIFAYALLQCLAQNNVRPMMVTSGITTVLHMFTCWILVFKSRLGNKGAALANAISYWINFLLLALYVWLSPSCKETWTGTPPKSKAGNFSSVNQSEYMLHHFHDTAWTSWRCKIPSSASTRVSNELGARRPQAARLAVCTAMFMVATEGILAAMTLILGHNIWGYCYSDDEMVVKYVGEMLLLLAVSHFFEGLQCILSGNARGCGWQKIGAIVNLGSYYLLGIPTGILLAFTYHIGGKGLWIGITVALFAQTSILLIITLRTNWVKEAAKASARVEIPVQVL
ncbi:hypothetical protein Leryth_017715 [Lithospermum erythrorhizon]|nr:hypothetical protein Leryth_017715 [Lithospermum erythrorhizon]